MIGAERCGDHVPEPLKKFLERLRQAALSLGAKDAKTVSAARIPVEDRIVEMCRPPRCELFGQSANCPPHVMSPRETRQWIRRFRSALIFKFDVPPESLFSDEGLGFFRKTFLTAAALEGICREDARFQSRGLAAGSCKMVFCRDIPCRALAPGGTCRYPDLARPSMEALGVNVFRMMEDIGWEIRPILRASRPEDIPSALLAGMVLVGTGENPVPDRGRLTSSSPPRPGKAPRNP